MKEAAECPHVLRHKTIMIHPDIFLSRGIPVFTVSDWKSCQVILLWTILSNLTQDSKTNPENLSPHLFYSPSFVFIVYCSTRYRQNSLLGTSLLPFPKFTILVSMPGPTLPRRETLPPKTGSHSVWKWNRLVRLFVTVIQLICHFDGDENHMLAFKRGYSVICK